MLAFKNNLQVAEIINLHFVGKSLTIKTRDGWTEFKYISQLYSLPETILISTTSEKCVLEVLNPYSKTHSQFTQPQPAPQTSKKVVKNYNTVAVVKNYNTVAVVKNYNTENKIVPFVYFVYSNDKIESLLYVGNKEEQRYLYNLFGCSRKSIQLDCKWNNLFNKWQIII